MEMVTFFGAGNPLSNWHFSEFSVKGIVFINNEQFMMYCKARLFCDEAIAEEILKAVSPAEHKRLGRRVRGFVEAQWREKRRPFVLAGCRAKFRQNPGLSDYLLNTGDNILVEASPYDRIWGVGLAATDPRIRNRKTWLGENLLGQILEQVRSEIAVEVLKPERKAISTGVLEALQEEQVRAIGKLFDAQVQENASAVEVSIERYAQTIIKLESAIGGLATCEEVDQILWEDYSNAYKREAGFRPAQPISRSAVLKWFEGRKTFHQIDWKAAPKR